MRYLWILFFFGLIGCLSNNKKSVNYDFEEDTVEVKPKKALTDYVDYVRERDYSSLVCLETVEELKKVYSYREVLILLTECYDVDSSNVQLNLELIKYYMISYKDCGENCIIHREKAEQVLNNVLSIDSDFNNFEEFQNEKNLLLKLAKKWNKSDSINRGILLEWGIDKFSLNSSVYQNKIKKNWDE